MQFPYTVIVGLDSLPGLQTTRILAKHKIPIIGIAREPSHYACKTRLCHKILYNNIQTEQVTEFLKELGKSIKEKMVLIPCTDMSVYWIAKHQKELEEWFYLAIPSFELVDKLQNKVSFYQYMEELKLPIPKTLIVKSVKDMNKTPLDIKFPVIVKPARRTLSWTTQSKNKVEKIQDLQSLKEKLPGLLQLSDQLIIQEWIEGSDEKLFSCTSYYNKSSQPLVSFMCRKIRQWPPEAGTSTLGIECHNDEVLNLTHKLLQACQYQGLADLEVKEEAGTKKNYIMELNVGRPTVLAPIAEAGGVEYIYTMYCDIVGMPLPSNRFQKYRKVKWLNLYTDIVAARAYFKKGNLNLFDWICSYWGIKYHAVFSFSDPLPFIYQTYKILFH